MSRQTSFRFCPYDRNPLQPVSGNELRGRLCRRCGFVDFANPKPAVAILTIRRGSILLAKRGVAPGKGMWDIPGGFVEPMESAEETVIREALEEMRVHVRVTRYLGSLPDTYGRRKVTTLNLAFVVEIVRGEPRPASDVAELRWFPMDQLPQRMAFAHQRVLLAQCRRELRRAKSWTKQRLSRST